MARHSITRVLTKTRVAYSACSSAGTRIPRIASRPSHSTGRVAPIGHHYKKDNKRRGSYRDTQWKIERGRRGNRREGLKERETERGVNSESASEINSCAHPMFAQNANCTIDIYLTPMECRSRAKFVKTFYLNKF